MGANQPPIQVQAQLRLECRYGLCSIEIYSVSDVEKTEGQMFDSRALGFSSSETQGQIKGARESLNGRKNIYGTKKSNERREEPLRDNVLPDQFQTVAVVLATDWRQKSCVFLAPIRNHIS